MPTSFPCPPIEALREQLQPLIGRLREALRLPAEMEGVLVTGSTAPPYNLLRLAYTLPASESHHDSEPLGLVSHSLRVATKAAELYRERVTEPALHDAPNREGWVRNLVAIYLTALMHDVGKLWFMDVIAGGRNWPVNRYLADFVRELGATEMQVAHRPGRTRAGPSGHEPISIVYLTMVVPLASLPRLGSQAMNDLLATLATTLGAQASSDVYQLVKEADTACTGEAMLRQRKPAPTPAKPYASGSGTIADDLVHGFRRIADDRRLRYNLSDGHLLVSPSHTVLFITMNGGNSVFRILYEANRQEVLRHGVGGYVKSFYEAGDPHKFLDEIAGRTLTSGTLWCVPAVASDTPDSHTIRHYCVVTEGGKKRRTGYAIIMRNEALWGPVDPSAKGCFSGQLALFAEDKKTTSADPEDLGFIAPDSTIAPHRQRAVKLNAAADAESTESVLDLESVTGALVREVGALVPTVSSGEHQRRWLDVSNAVTDRAPEMLVLTALEACLDRLRHHRSVLARGDVASGQPIAIPSAAATTSPAEAEGSKDATGGGLAVRVSALIGALVVAARKAGATSPAAEGNFHALALGDGSVFLPWPQCLDRLIDPSDQVLAVSPDALSEILTLVHLPKPAPARIVGFAYGPGRKHHRGLTVPGIWKPVATGGAVDGAVLASGRLESQPAGTTR